MPAKSKAVSAAAPEEQTASAVPAEMVSIFNMVQQPHPPMKKAIGMMNKICAKQADVRTTHQNKYYVLSFLSFF